MIVHDFTEEQQSRLRVCDHPEEKNASFAVMCKSPQELCGIAYSANPFVRKKV